MDEVKKGQGRPSMAEKYDVIIGSIKSDIEALKVISNDSKIKNIEDTIKGILDELEKINKRFDSQGQSQPIANGVLPGRIPRDVLVSHEKVHTNYGPIPRDGKGNPLDPVLAAKLESGKSMVVDMPGLGQTEINLKQ